jgi:hypothetical protein
MPVTFEDGTIRVSASYSLKTSAGVEYSTHDAYLGVSVEFPAEGNTDELLEVASVFEGELQNHLKENVFAALDVDGKFTETGVLVPDLKPPVVAAPVQQGYVSSSGQPSQGGAGGGQSFSPPKASSDTISALPRVTLDGEVFIDQRSLKPTTYSAKAADFKSATDSNKSLWLYSKDGSLNADVAAKATAAGLVFPATRQEAYGS